MPNSIQLSSKVPWNKGKLVGQKQVLKLEEVWAVRIRLEVTNKTRDLALFNRKRESNPTLKIGHTLR